MIQKNNKLLQRVRGYSNHTLLLASSPPLAFLVGHSILWIKKVSQNLLQTPTLSYLYISSTPLLKYLLLAIHFSRFSSNTS